MASRESFLADQGQWVVSADEELFDCSEQFATQQEANDFAVDEGYHSYVGQIEKPDPSDFIDAEGFLYQFGDGTNDEFSGEWFEGYLSDGVTKEQHEDLKRLLGIAFRVWLSSHDHWPSACNVVNVESVEEA